MNEPILIKVGDSRVLLGSPGRPPRADCRVISEDNYQYLKNRIKALEALVKAASCPHCDGSGVLQTRIMRSGSRQISETEREPIAIEDFEIEPCQWCYEKGLILEKCACEMPAKIKGDNKCYKCKKILEL